MGFEDFFESFVPVVGHIDGVTDAFEIEGDEVCDIDFIFDDENVFHVFAGVKRSGGGGG